MKRIFVYGTLMKGGRASGFLADSIYKGEFVLDDYAMYNLGPFPGIKERPGGKVIGEMYEVRDSLIPQLDSYEGEGDLYTRVVVSVSNKHTYIDDVYVYVYLGSVSGDEVRSKWNSCKKYGK